MYLSEVAALEDARERELIRDALDETLVVEAAAGTGKTTELVARIVRLLGSGKATVDRIAAVTFTEKAAGELKLRVREELERARSSADGATREPLEQALAHLEEAHISTIHGFCAELLRERPVEAVVDPEFAVLTEAQSDRLFDEAFRVWLQRQLQDPGEGVRRSLRRPDPPRRDEPNVDGPVARLRNAGRALREWRDFDRPWRRDPFDREAEIGRLTAAVLDFAALTETASSPHDGLYRSTAAVRRLASDLQRARDEDVDDPDGAEAGLIALLADQELREARRRPGGRAGYGTGVTRSQVLQAYDRLMQSLEGFQRAADADLAARLQQDLQGCLAIYEDLKRRAGVLDFLDLLLRARALVRDRPDVRATFQRRLRFIFVDEFQDTDPLQAEILLLLAADESHPDAKAPAAAPPDWRTIPIRRGALFIVGDPKQSIYRFRRADVGTYQEVCERLVRTQHAVPVTLSTSFRSVPGIQRVVNAAFSSVMTGDRRTLQARYVPLGAHRLPPGADPAGDGPQPAVVALPVPRPYGKRNVAGYAIEASLPDAVGAFVDWLVHESGWTVVERANGLEERVGVQPRHICVLFRRFVSYQDDVTRGYVEALEARGVPHLLVGGRSFHEREEVETLRAALSAIEWPDDQLSVYATLRGGLFAIGEESLLDYWHRHPRRRFHPFDVPEDLPPSLEPVRDALLALRALHIPRNHRPVADTIAELLRITRAHVGFVLRPAGEQALANVMHVAELARQYEADGGISFRGFVDELQLAADRLDAPEAPVLEEGSEGVRLMTVHKAKGLEFPVVILADPTCKLNRTTAGRALDAERRRCAIRLGGWAPVELLEQQDEEVARDEAEGVRLAYVAATRARDLLVVSAVGDSEIDGWLRPLNRSIYPPASRRRHPEPAPACPPFRTDTVLERPGGDPAGEWTVAPGLHRFAVDRGPAQEPPGENAGAEVDVVWWDPLALRLGAQAPGGLRREELIAKEQSELLDAEGLARYRAWQEARGNALAGASAPSLRVRTMTEWARSGDPWPVGELMADVKVLRLPRRGPRPAGTRFGTLVHAVFALAPLDGSERAISAIAGVQGRLLGAAAAEVTAAAELVTQALREPLLSRAADAERLERCRREVPVTLSEGGWLFEGTVDLLFEEHGRWQLVDFKSDLPTDAQLDVYRRQVALYAAAASRALGLPVDPVILAV